MGKLLCTVRPDLCAVLWRGAPHEDERALQVPLRYIEGISLEHSARRLKFPLPAENANVNIGRVGRGTPGLRKGGEQSSVSSGLELGQVGAHSL